MGTTGGVRSESPAKIRAGSAATRDLQLAARPARLREFEEVVEQRKRKRALAAVRSRRRGWCRQHIGILKRS
jgi:hypothetical protein